MAEAKRDKDKGYVAQNTGAGKKSFMATAAALAALGGGWAISKLGGGDLRPPADSAADEVRNSSTQPVAAVKAEVDGATAATKTKKPEAEEPEVATPSAKLSSGNRVVLSADDRAGFAEPSVDGPAQQLLKMQEEAEYTKWVNDGLIVERSAEKIKADDAIAAKFAETYRQDSRYSNMAEADLKAGILNGYYATVERGVAEENIVGGLEALMNGARATPEQIDSYLANLKKEGNKAALDAFAKQANEAVDVRGRFGMGSLGAIEQSLAKKKPTRSR